MRNAQRSTLNVPRSTALVAAILLAGGAAVQAAPPTPRASHPPEAWHLPLPLPPGVTIQTALDASNCVVLSKGDYSGGAPFTLRSGQQLYGDPAGTTISPVTVAPGASNAVLSSVNVGGAGTLTFPPSTNTVTRDCVFERLGAKLTVTGGELGENLFLHTDGTIKINTVTNGFLRNNRFIRTKAHAWADQLIMLGDTQRLSYGNVFLWKNFLTPGADSTRIENQGDLTFVGVDAESWNWWGTGSGAALIKVGRMGTLRIFGMNGGNHRYGTNADGITGTADDNVVYDNRTGDFDVDADVFQLFNDSMEVIGNSLLTGKPFIDYKLGTNNLRSLLVNSANSGKVWTNAATEPFRLKAFAGGSTDTATSRSSTPTPVWTLRSSALPLDEQAILREMVVSATRPAGHVPWEAPDYGPIPDPAGPGWATNRIAQADATAYIQGLIDVHGIARLPAGVYVISQPLKLSRTQGIIGAGVDTTVIIASTNTLDMVVANDPVGTLTGTPLMLADITFQGGRNGIHFEPVGTSANLGRYAQYTGGYYNHVTFRNMSNAGIFMDQIYALDNIFFGYVHFVDCDTGLKQKVDPAYSGGENPTMMYMDKVVFYGCQFVGNRLALDLTGARSCNLNAWVNCRFQDNREGAAAMANYLTTVFANCDFINNGGAAVVRNNYTVGHVSSSFVAGSNGVAMLGGPISADGCVFDRGESTTAKILSGSNSRFFLNNCATTNMLLHLPAGANGMLINTTLGMDPALNHQMIAFKNGTACTLLAGTPAPASKNGVLPTSRFFPAPQAAVPGVASDVVATGGTRFKADDFLTHTFTNSGAFVVVTGGDAEVLIVGGGGGGGVSAGGGGGAGGVIVTNVTLMPGTYSVTVGAGGVGGLPAAWASSNGFPSIFGALTALGGGGGASVTIRAGNGGSGGGASRWSNGTGLAGAGAAGQGCVGGSAPYVVGAADIAGAGGGGAGGVGSSVATNSNTGGNGGDGVACGFSGTTIIYGGGGGGGSRYGTGGAGGLGGGGRGAQGMQTGRNGAPHSGGGGGGGGMAANTFFAGGTGGTGIVIIRYRLPRGIVQATGGAVATDQRYVTHTFTNSGELVVSSGGAAEVLVVAGGGGGGVSAGGGGGGGGVLYYDKYALKPGAYGVIVGDGGRGGTPSVWASSDGANSSLGPLTALGGGGGGGVAAWGNPGGAGGGGSRWSNGSGGGGVGTVGQGCDGGNAQIGGWIDCTGGGGGGAGGVGQPIGGATLMDGGTGGVGVVCGISGSTIWYGGGGGGGARYGIPAAGGLGGGGHAGIGRHAGVAGTPNSGGGGGAGGMVANDFYAGGAGGSGIVIVRYPLDPGTVMTVANN